MLNFKDALNYRFFFYTEMYIATKIIKQISVS